jgi:L-threonylcarbamoyladenylate synthase
LFYNLGYAILTEGKTIIATVDPNAIQRAATLLRKGGLVAFPTETVYGLGADATNDAAVASIYAAKNRPDFNPLIVHFTDMGAAADAVIFDDRAKRVAQAFWPGALTLVLPRRDDCNISLLASAGLNTLAVRVPSQPIAQALFKATARPVAAPSANRSFSVSPTTATHVVDDLSGRIDLILDGGPCPVGLESTVIDLSTPLPTLLRPGGIPTEDIEAVTGPLAAAGEGAPKSPGMLSRHYAPNRPVRLNVAVPREGEAFLAFGPNADNATMNLSESGDISEAAANLFAMMRILDRDEFDGIAVAPVPEKGLGVAINDRLRRASNS